MISNTQARIILVTGGARSGKSRYAESLCTGHERVVYIATSRADDEEMRQRIQLHQQSRPAEWNTVEGTYNLHQEIPEASCYLLDCVSLLTSNILFDLTQGTERISPELQQQVEARILHEVSELIDVITERKGMLVLVTNEVGSSIVPEHHIARVYRDILGRVNQRIAALSDEVYLAVCGIPLKIK